MPTWPTSQQQQSVGFGYKVPAQSATVSPAASGPAPSAPTSYATINAQMTASSQPQSIMVESSPSSSPQPTQTTAPQTSSASSSSSQAAKMSPTPIVSATSVTRMTAPILVRRPAPSAANTAAPQPAMSSVVDKLADAMAAMTGGRGDTNVSVTAAGPAAQPKVSDIRAGGAATQATTPSTGPDKILIGAIVVAALAAGYLIFKKKGK